MNDAGINFSRAKRHKNPHTRLRVHGAVIGQAIGIGASYCQGQYDFCEDQWLVFFLDKVVLHLLNQLLSRLLKAASAEWLVGLRFSE